MSIRAERLAARAVIEGTTARDISAAETRALARLRGLPVSRIIQIIQYLQDQVIKTLDKVPARKQEREMFAEIVDLLHWCLASDDRARMAEQKLYLVQLERELLLDRLRLAEQDLARYQTCEELLTTDFLEHYLEGARRRLNDLTVREKKNVDNKQKNR